MREKLSIKEFRKLKTKITEFIKSLDELYQQTSDEEAFEKVEEMFLKEYYEMEKVILSYDLSEIPFKEWKDLPLLAREEYPLDFSDTNANIDAEYLKETGVDLNYITL